MGTFFWLTRYICAFLGARNKIQSATAIYIPVVSKEEKSNGFSHTNCQVSVVRFLTGPAFPCEYKIKNNYEELHRTSGSHLSACSHESGMIFLIDTICLGLFD